MNVFGNNPSSRQAVIHGLAVAGFIALVGTGMWLAVYSTRYVPSVVNRIGAAAVYLGSVFTPKEESSLSVVPTASTTISFGEPSPTSTSATAEESATSARTNWTPGTPIAVTNGTTTPSTHATPTYSGLPDLEVTIETVGYMATDGSISATTTIPAHAQIAMKFRVTNIGTNVSGPWTMNISIPSGGASANQTFTQDSLVPSQPSEYIARFDNITPGADRTITVTIDPNHTLSESSVANNIATSTSLTVLGS